MRIFVTGADGFIGGRIVRALHEAGHVVVCGVRRPATRGVVPGLERVPVDFATDHQEDVWVPRVTGMDVVVNAVGIIRPSPGQCFEDLHHRAPCALFDACASAGVQRVVQVSALGAEAVPDAAYHQSKRAADDHLASLPLEWVIVRPSLVVGRGAASNALFAAMAVWPVLFLPGGGEARFRPVAADDLAAGVVRIVGSPGPLRQVVDAVGPESLSLAAVLGAFRHWLGFGPAPEIRVPLPMVRLVALLGDRLGPSIPLTSEMLRMLLAGNIADAGPWERLTGLHPRSVDEALGSRQPTDRLQARLFVLTPLLRCCIAFVWIATALVCAFAYPLSESSALVMRAGGTAATAPWLVYGLSALDGALGVATLFRWHIRPLLLLQVALVAGYSLVMAWALPEFWLHPFGPLTKNIPLLGATLVLWALEDDGR